MINGDQWLCIKNRSMGSISGMMGGSKSKANVSPAIMSYGKWWNLVAVWIVLQFNLPERNAFPNTIGYNKSTTPKPNWWQWIWVRKTANHQKIKLRLWDSLRFDYLITTWQNGKQCERNWQGQKCMSRWHPILKWIGRLQHDDFLGTWPLNDVLQCLPNVHHQTPNTNHLTTDEWIHVPIAVWIRESIEELIP